MPPAVTTAETPAFVHQSVLMEAVKAAMPSQAHTLVDATLGGGGHALSLLEQSPTAQLFGCDRDPAALEAAQQRLQPHAQRIMLKQLAFDDLHHQVLLGTVDFLLADLGVSSPQIDVGERGFSFMQDGPLDMRMEGPQDTPHPRKTAADLVQQLSAKELKQLIWRYGEDNMAPKIAAAIVKAREQEPILRTGQLAKIVAQAVPTKLHRKGHHPATRTFQALRMEVNDELGQLERLLTIAPRLLANGGRLAVITFHSLEDRMVKTTFRSWIHPCTCPPNLPACACGKLPLGRLVHKKAVGATEEEIKGNPRSRSAKLRVFERIW